MEYLLKVSAVVAIFYVCYKLFLQRDTFFEHNRWFLLFGLVTSFLVPFFVIPNYIEYVPTETAFLNYENISVTNETEKAFNILDYFPLIYGLGVLCFLIRFLIQLSSLSVVIFKNENVKDGRYTFVKTNKNISPFSFFNWIVYNPTNFTKTDLDQIITHEKAHANQFHSIDILLTQLVNIVLWFNPIIWFYNKDLKQNLEFIADKTAQNKLKCKKSYQTILLKTSIPSHQMVLSNNFYNSLIKKRIVMLHKSKSKKINQIKFALVIPLLAIFLMSFNTKDIYIEKDAPTLESSIIDDTLSENNFESLIEETKSNISLEDDKSPSKPASVNSKIKKSVEKPISKVVQEKTEITIDKNTTDASLHKISASLKDKGIDSKFKSVKRNNQGEIIAIKIKVSSKVSNANYNINSDEPIKPVLILIDNGGKNISIGNH
ncbi:MAG: M56 family metallopeptidase, partial [Flavobacteriaceae bacterium]